MTTRFWYLLSKKISGEAGQEELTELDELVRENPEWAYSAGQLHKIWKTRATEPGLFNAEIAFDEHLARMKQNGIELPGMEQKEEAVIEKRNSTEKRFWVQAVAMVVILAAVALVWQLEKAKHPQVPATQGISEVQADLKSKIKVVLPDSSIVWLNAGSKMTYNEEFGVKNRNVTLSGEGYFEVRKTGIPFIIHTNDIRIRVLGTVFNVRSYPNEKTETSLLHGSVEITLDKRPGEKYLLKPNEKLVVSNLKIGSTNMEKKEPIVVLQHLLPTENHTVMETSWVDNKLVFQEESFSDLAVRMERWYGVKINIQDENIASQRLSGSFTTETIQEAMEALKLSTSFHYEMKQDLITITK